MCRRRARCPFLRRQGVLQELGWLARLALCGLLRGVFRRIIITVLLARGSLLGAVFAFLLAAVGSFNPAMSLFLKYAEAFMKTPLCMPLVSPW